MQVEQPGNATGYINPAGNVDRYVRPSRNRYKRGHGAKLLFRCRDVGLSIDLRITPLLEVLWEIAYFL